jgi:hypothetical protein
MTSGIPAYSTLIGPFFFGSDVFQVIFFVFLSIR